MLFMYIYWSTAVVLVRTYCWQLSFSLCSRRCIFFMQNKYFEVNEREKSTEDGGPENASITSTCWDNSRYCCYKYNHTTTTLPGTWPLADWWPFTSSRVDFFWWLLVRSSVGVVVLSFSSSMSISRGSNVRACLVSIKPFVTWSRDRHRWSCIIRRIIDYASSDGSSDLPRWDAGRLVSWKGLVAISINQHIIQVVDDS